MAERDEQILGLEKCVHQYSSFFLDLKNQWGSLEGRVVQQERCTSKECLVFQKFPLNPNSSKWGGRGAGNLTENCYHS